MCRDTKEIGIRLHSQIIKKLTIDPINIWTIQSIISGLRKGIKDFSVYKASLEKELCQPTNKYIFHHFSYPKLPIYASSVFGYIKYNDYREKVLSDTPWENVFFHIIPQISSTEIIIGYYSEFTNDEIIQWISEWYICDYNSMCQKITELLVNHVEDWGLAPSLFKSIPEHKKRQFLDTFEKNLLFHDASLTADFNFFSDLN